MVFRFTEENDKELMREVIAQKPFAAKYGESARVWAHVAQQVSTAIQEVVGEKQVRDRVRLLKKNWRVGDLRSALGSGIEETLEAVNEQSHYETLTGLVMQYVLLEDAFTDDKKDRVKKKKETRTTRCASEIVEEAMIRRSQRGDQNYSDGSPSENDDSGETSSTKSTPAKPRSNKRKSAFQLEADRQDKRLRDDMELRQQQFAQQMAAQAQHHADRITLERDIQMRRIELEQARIDAQDQAELRAQQARNESEERNRQLILECVKALGAAVFKTDNK